MIPLKDNIPSRTLPFVNYLLIIANTLIFFYELSLGEDLPRFFLKYGFIPAFLGTKQVIDASGVIFTIPLYFSIRSLLTSLFLHGGWLHYLSNMLYLWIFGDNVEDRMGHGCYLIFYLICGVAANLVQFHINPYASVPTIGASGAIAGVLGAYFILYPYARILTMIPIFIFIEFIQLPAFFLLLFWFIQQYIMGTLSTAMPGQSGIAWWAHIGGFVSGMILVLLFQRNDRRPLSSEYWVKKQSKYYQFH